MAVELEEALDPAAPPLPGLAIHGSPSLSGRWPYAVLVLLPIWLVVRRLRRRLRRS